MAHVEVSCQRRTGHWLTIHGQQQASSFFWCSEQLGCCLCPEGSSKKSNANPVPCQGEQHPPVGQVQIPKLQETALLRFGAVL